MTEENMPVAAEEQLVLEETTVEDVVMTDVAEEESAEDEVVPTATEEQEAPTEEEENEEAEEIVEDEPEDPVSETIPADDSVSDDDSGPPPLAEGMFVDSEEEAEDDGPVPSSECDYVSEDDSGPPPLADGILVDSEDETEEEPVTEEPPVPFVEEKAAPVWEEPVKPKEMVAMGVPTKEDQVIEKTSPAASGWTQVKALCEKNMLTKMRTPGATAAELLSPVLLMLVLWFASNMSDVVYRPHAYFHYLNVDMPFFWDTGNAEDNDFETFDPADTHRRRMMTVDGEDGLQAVDYGLEEGEEEATKWNWARLLGEGLDSNELGEDMGLINDFFMLNHARSLNGEFQMMDDVDMMGDHSFNDDGVQTHEDEEDSGDWYEEVWADIKGETIDKIDWEEVEAEVKDNFGELWDTAKDYIFASTYSSARWRLNQMRVRVRVDPLGLHGMFFYFMLSDIIAFPFLHHS